jgi:hypothetical protein
MNAKGKKLEPKLGLDMPFGEALGRLIQTKPKEVEASILKAKKKKPPDVSDTRRPERKKKRRT